MCKNLADVLGFCCKGWKHRPKALRVKSATGLQQRAKKQVAWVKRQTCLAPEILSMLGAESASFAGGRKVPVRFERIMLKDLD
jgi:hypothetical protein